MAHLKDEVLALVKKSNLIPDERKAAYLESVTAIDDAEQLGEIKAYLSTESDFVMKMMGKSIEQDADLIPKLEAAIKKGKRELLEAQESDDRAGEAEEIESLFNEL